MRLTQGPNHLIWVEYQTGGKESTQLVIEKIYPKCPIDSTFLGSSWADEEFKDPAGVAQLLSIDP